MVWACGSSPCSSAKNNVPSIIAALLLLTAPQAAAAHPLPAYTPHYAYFPETQTIKEYVEQQLSDRPTLIQIADCESDFRMVEGKVNADDFGVLQINDHYHEEPSQSLGLDTHTLYGNVTYGKHLYDER